MADGPSRVPLHSLESMTNNFSEDRVLGSGAYGKVYLGKREDGQKIAVKIFHGMPEHGNGHFEKEFYNLANLQHQNIVRLVGYCHETRREFLPHNETRVLAEVMKSALCFEFMENGSLNSYLFDESNGHDWRMRYTIIKGICNGLKYLHEELKPPIFHLDLKPANILLDKNMIPKIADFGLSRFFNEEKSHITNSPIGTFGYLPPEFINQNIISNKLDIFSLGVVIIKIMAGPTGYSRSAEMTSEQFAEIVHGNWRNRLQAAAAGDLLESYSEQVKSCIEIALSCVEADRRRRPTIGDIVNMLTDTETRENYHGALIDQVQEEKRTDRPVSFSTVICEAMVMKQVQNVFMALEPLLQRVVRDEIRAGLVRSPRYIERSSPETPAEPPAWMLAFLCPPALPIFTGSKIEDVNGKPLRVILVDADTGSPFGALPQFMRVELVPLFGDFPPDGREDWTAGEFARGVVKERAGKRPLLTGDVGLTMRDGHAVVKELQFTDNSSWVRCRKFRIGARVVPGSYEGGRVAEAMTQAFNVRDHRGALYRKHYPPALGDDVWRLEKIGKEGAFHRKLWQHGVKNVQEFLRMLMMMPEVLRAIMGCGMTDRMWEVTTSHAKTCDAGDKVFAYAGQHGATVYVNSICQLVKIEVAGIDCAAQQLSMVQKAFVHQLHVEALGQRENLQEAEPATMLLHASSSSSSSSNSLPMLHNAAPVAPPPLPATPIVDEFSRCPGRTHGNPIEQDASAVGIKHDETMFGSD